MIDCLYISDKGFLGVSDPDITQIGKLINRIPKILEKNLKFSNFEFRVRHVKYHILNPGTR